MSDTTRPRNMTFDIIACQQRTCKINNTANRTSSDVFCREFYTLLEQMYCEYDISLIFIYISVHQTVKINTADSIIYILFFHFSSPIF